jgi:hypothetical protein
VPPQDPDPEDPPVDVEAAQNVALAGFRGATRH